MNFTLVRKWRPSCKNILHSLSPHTTQTNVNIVRTRLMPSLSVLAKWHFECQSFHLLFESHLSISLGTTLKSSVFPLFCTFNVFFLLASPILSLYLLVIALFFLFLELCCSKDQYVLNSTFLFPKSVSITVSVLLHLH